MTKLKIQFFPKQLFASIKILTSGCQQKIGHSFYFALTALIIFWGSVIKTFLRSMFIAFGWTSRMIGRFLHIKTTEWAEAWILLFKLPPLWLLWSGISILCVFALIAGTHYGSKQAWQEVIHEKH